MARAYLKGLPQYKAKITGLATKLRPAMRPHMEAAAELVCNQMRRLVQVSSRKKGGRLKASIGWTWGAPPAYAQKLAQAAGFGEVLTIFAGNELVRTAHIVEKGSKPHFQPKRNRQHPGSKPYPFFFVSWRALKRQVNRMLRAAIKSEMKAAAA